MDKKYTISMMASILTFVVTYLLLSTNDNHKGFNVSFEKAGQPDQMEHNDQAQFENAKMVSEGSQFGVQYYNKANTTNMNTD